ncbi:metal-dependent hydrolase [Bacillus tianshenii]|nr:metal-dependent hydrolase [Bacillus tianshenii]
MDTGTHLVIGAALGGLATLDPIAASHPETLNSIMLGTMIGQQAPDFDTVLKLKNNAKYIRNHRGVTHSIPAVLLWPLLITGAIYAVSPDVNLLHLWIWTFLAVFLHVFVDIFNAYGTQAIRPFSHRWVALGIINTFDPFIFFIHIAGFIIWRFGGHPGYTFIVIYLILFGYYLLRWYAKHRVVKAVKQRIPDATRVITSPTVRFNYWHLAIESPDAFYVAKAVKDDIRVLDIYDKVPVPNIPLIHEAKKDDNLSAFLSFSPVYRWEVDEYNDHYEVRFIDLRYRSKGYYPFVAVVQLDQDLNIVSSYTGWIFSEEKLMKKLQIAPDA